MDFYLVTKVININLVKQIPNKRVRDDIARVYYGLIPNNGKTYSIKSILENEDYYRKLSERTDKEGSKNGGLKAL